MLHVFQELRLGSTWVTEHQDVDVTTKTMLSLNILAFTADQRQSNGSLDVVVTVDGGCDTLENLQLSMIVSRNNLTRRAMRGSRDNSKILALSSLLKWLLTKLSSCLLMELASITVANKGKPLFAFKAKSKMLR